MFDLEQTIAEWRRQMLAAGIKSPVPLEELEIHLCEDIERQIEFGLNVQQAFEIAVQHIGTPETIRAEFNKTNQRTIMKRMLLISAGILGILVGMGFVMPAVAQYRHEGAMTHGEVMLFCLGLVLTLGGIGSSIFGAKKRAA